MKPSIFFVFILFVFVTCSTVEDVDIGLNPPKLVVNSLFSSDSVWRVNVTRTINIANNPSGFSSYPNIQDAVVTLYDENNSFVEKLELVPGENGTTLYKSKNYPQVGKPYFIQVDVDNEPSLKANNYVPEKVSISSVETDSSQIESMGDLFLDVIFTDPSGAENFYAIKIIEEGYYLNYFTRDTLRYKSNLYFEPVDPVYEDNYSSTYGLFFNDHLFDGKPVNFKLKVVRYSSQNVALRTKVILFTLTQEHYKYISSENAQYSSGNDPLAQPALIFTNVENGLGIFAGFGTSIFELK